MHNHKCPYCNKIWEHEHETGWETTGEQCILFYEAVCEECLKETK